MRILHLLDIPWHSGLADYALRLAALELKAGHNSWVAVRPGTPAAEAADRLRIPRVEGLRPSDWYRLRRFLRGERIEVLNAHTGASHTLAALAFGGWRERGDHPAAAERSPALIRTRADARPARRRPLTAWVCRRTAFYVGATAEIARQFVERLPVPSDRVRVVYPAVQLPDHPDASASRDASGPGPADPLERSADAPNVTLVGRLDPVKGHAVFLEAAARVRSAFPSVRFTVVGREEHVTIPGLREIGRRLELADAVHYTGPVPDVGPWMRAATLGVIPSVGSEAVSRVALEWMAHGRAVVASAVGGLPEFVEDGTTGRLVPPGQPARLAEAIVRLLVDPIERARMESAARERAASRFSPDRLLRETLEIYEEARCRS